VIPVNVGAGDTLRGKAKIGAACAILSSEHLVRP
jgi:hypothetical protein